MEIDKNLAREAEFIQLKSTVQTLFSEFNQLKDIHDRLFAELYHFKQVSFNEADSLDCISSTNVHESTREIIKTVRSSL